MTVVYTTTKSLLHFQATRAQFADNHCHFLKRCILSLITYLCWFAEPTKTPEISKNEKILRYQLTWKYFEDAVKSN